MPQNGAYGIWTCWKRPWKNTSGPSRTRAHRFPSLTSSLMLIRELPIQAALLFSLSVTRRSLSMSVQTDSLNIPQRILDAYTAAYNNVSYRRFGDALAAYLSWESAAYIHIANLLIDAAYE